MLTWMFGTGATGTGAHPFCLRVQGVDYIGSVPIESISVNASVSSNATMTFTVIDPAGTMAVPEPWADVELLDTTEQQWLFGGVVMGVEVSYFGPLGVRMDVRCVDYGILLDVTPIVASFTVGTGDYLFVAAQSAAAAAPLGGITAMRWTGTSGMGRIQYEIVDAGWPEGYLVNNIAGAAAKTITPWTAARSVLETLADEVDDPYVDDLPRPAWVYVTPLKQLVVEPRTATGNTAPLEIRQDPTTSGHVAATEISVDFDYRSLETGVRITDSDTTTGGDNSDTFYGTENGYTLMPSTMSVALTAAGSTPWLGKMYTSLHGIGASGQATVVCAKNFMPGQALVVDYPAIGLDDTYPITAVSTRFLGGTSLMRQVTVQFSGEPVAPVTPSNPPRSRLHGERGTVARFNRQRFARAGVTT